MANQILILQEVEMHPNSLIDSISEKFEKPSIVHCVTKDGLKKFNKPPIFDDNYLVLFDSARILEANIPYMNLDFVFPILHCTSKSSTYNAVEICKDKGLDFKVYVNEFTKKDAYEFIRGLASCQPSDTFCKTLVSRVGLSPKRIISAVMVCEQVGFEVVNISKYIDKYVYIDVQDVVECLLGKAKSAAQQRRAALYIHTNRLWYSKYTRNIIIREVEGLIKIFNDFISGELTAYTVHDYVDKNGMSRYYILYASRIFEEVSYNELIALRNFLSKATVLDVALRLM